MFLNFASKSSKFQCKLLGYGYAATDNRTNDEGSYVTATDNRTNDQGYGYGYGSSDDDSLLDDAKSNIYGLKLERKSLKITTKILNYQKIKFCFLPSQSFDFLWWKFWIANRYGNGQEVEVKIRTPGGTARRGSQATDEGMALLKKFFM